MGAGNAQRFSAVFKSAGCDFVGAVSISVCLDNQPLEERWTPGAKLPYVVGDCIQIDFRPDQVDNSL